MTFWSYFGFWFILLILLTVMTNSLKKLKPELIDKSGNEYYDVTDTDISWHHLLPNICAVDLGLDPQKDWLKKPKTGFDFKIPKEINIII